MTRFPVSSAIIKEVYFDEAAKLLRICFANGEERRFGGVPRRLVEAMVEAPSPGNYYVERIRSRFVRVA